MPIRCPLGNFPMTSTRPARMTRLCLTLLAAAVAAAPVDAQKKPVARSMADRRPDPAQLTAAPGDYAAADPWTTLNGSPLNGQWKFVVTDLWPMDNGFLFDWTISFDPQAVGDCSGPIIE